MRRMVGTVVLAAMFMTIPAVAYASPHNEHGWSDGGVVTLQITQESTKAVGKTIPEYVVAPLDASAPLNEAEDGFGPYDLVVHSPGPGYSSLFRPTAVLPSARATDETVAWRWVQAEDDQIPLAYAADLGSGLVPLNSVARVEQAARLGLVDFIDFGITEVCHVVP